MKISEVDELSRTKDPYEKFRIADYKHWAIYLHPSQYYLGRVYIWSKREGLVDLMQITAEEMDELFEIGLKLRQVLCALFKPDLFNYAALGNDARQLHLHVIPRYSDQRDFAGVQFIDGRWGQNYAPYNYDFKIAEETLMVIRRAIADRFKGRRVVRKKK